MQRVLRWIGLYVGAIAALVIAYGVTYNLGMAMIEDRPQSLFHSLKIVLMHFFTVGYVTEYPSSTIMKNFTLLMSFTGWLINLLSLFCVTIIGIHKFSSATSRT